MQLHDHLLKDPYSKALLFLDNLRYKQCLWRKSDNGEPRIHLKESLPWCWVFFISQTLRV